MCSIACNNNNMSLHKDEVMVFSEMVGLQC